MKSALKRANAEAAERRIKLQEYEEAERKRKEAEMTELEKAQTKLSEMEQQMAALKDQNRQARITAAVKLKAAELNFHDPSDASAFIDGAALTLTDEGEVEGVEPALKALAKARPYLVKSDAGPKSPPDGDKRNVGKPKTDDRAFAGRYGVTVYDD